MKGLLQQGGNQIEFIINACKPKAMRMALQASVYDPVRDQTDARQGFPCLQHIAFVPDFTRQTLSLNAFYAMQLLFVKAYGNWLGLMQLGAFVASQTNLRFERLNCFTGIQKLSSDKRPHPGELLERLTDLAGNCIGEKKASRRRSGRVTMKQPARRREPPPSLFPVGDELLTPARSSSTPDKPFLCRLRSMTPTGGSRSSDRGSFSVDWKVRRLLGRMFRSCSLTSSRTLTVHPTGSANT